MCDVINNKTRIYLYIKKTEIIHRTKRSRKELKSGNFLLSDNINNTHSRPKFAKWRIKQSDVFVLLLMSFEGLREKSMARKIVSARDGFSHPIKISIRSLSRGTRAKYNQNTCHYIVSDDLHVIVPIGSGVLVPKPNYMSQFMHDDSEFVAIFSDGYSLWTVATFSNKRAASENINIV